MKNKNIFSKFASVLLLSVAVAHTANASPSGLRGEFRDRSSYDGDNGNDKNSFELYNRNEPDYRDRDSRDRNDWGSRDSRDRSARDGRDSRDRNDRGASRMDRRVADPIVRAFYRAFLFREGEPAGVQYYIDVLNRSGESALPEMARGIASSPEYRQNIDRRYRPEEILSNMYRELFGRDVDSSGRNTYLPMMRQGRAGEVAKSLVSSSEFRQRYLR